MKNTASLPFTDDFNLPCSEMRYLPYGGDGNILVSRFSYEKEMRFRKGRIAIGLSFDLPKWNSLKIYSVE